jgi:hypothetical protein
MWVSTPPPPDPLGPNGAQCCEGAGGRSRMGPCVVMITYKQTRKIRTNAAGDCDAVGLRKCRDFLHAPAGRDPE